MVRRSTELRRFWQAPGRALRAWLSPAGALQLVESELDRAIGTLHHKAQAFEVQIGEFGPTRLRKEEAFRFFRELLNYAPAVVDAARLRSRAQLAAENLFLRKQLALYLERQAKPRRADNATRIALVALSRFLDWRPLLTVVRPETLIRWHRKGFRLFWRWKSRTPGRPPILVDIQRLIETMAAANRTWGEERIAAELLVKLGIRVSPRTVRRYMSSRHPRPISGNQAWSTFVRNHARSVLASDFFVVVTASFRLVYVFVVLEIATRRIVHWNVTTHPTADWTTQQFRMIVPGDQGHRFVIHDRDAIYSEGVNRALQAMGLVVLRTAVRAPQANAFCERLIGTIRRECLDS